MERLRPRVERKPIEILRAAAAIFRRRGCLVAGLQQANRVALVAVGGGRARRQG